MYIETVPNRNSRPAILLREGWREGARVRKKTLANLTDWPAEKVDSLRRVLKGQRLVSPDAAFTIERSAPHGHLTARSMTARLRKGFADRRASPLQAHLPLTMRRSRPSPSRRPICPSIPPVS